MDLHEERDWEDWPSSDNEEVEDRRQYLFKERRQYKMLERINVDKWDDVDFYYRYRMHKTTFFHVRAVLESKLQFDNPR